MTETAFDRQMARKAAREANRKPRCRPRARKKKKPPTKAWSVQCVGNANVQYTVTGPIQPRHCPACGGPASSRSPVTDRLTP